MSMILKGIDLPKEQCDYIPMRIYANGHIWINGSYKGVAIQIPKGHGRLIDGDYAKYNLENYGDLPTKYLHMDLVREAIDDAPTILEAEEE